MIPDVNWFESAGDEDTVVLDDFVVVAVDFIVFAGDRELVVIAGFLVVVIDSVVVVVVGLPKYSIYPLPCAG